MLARPSPPLEPRRAATRHFATVGSAVAPALAVGVATVLGTWFFGGVVTNDFELSLALTALWLTGLGVAVLAVAWRSRRLALPMLGTYVVTAGIVGGYLAVTTFVGSTVVEDVPMGRPASEAPRGASLDIELSRGAFAGIAHPTSGEAAVVELRSGERVLELLDFRTAPGPDLRLYLVAGSVDGDSDPGDHVDLGALKGNAGTQLYEIPAGVDTERYTTVLVWCRAFSVPFGAAELAPS